MTDTVHAMIHSEVDRIQHALSNFEHQIAHLRSLIELADLLARGQAELPLADGAPRGGVTGAADPARRGLCAPTAGC